jgi:hypothetical protein
MSETSNTLKDFTLPLKVCGNGYLLNNTMPTQLKGESEFKLQGLVFITKQ